uniref:Tyrosinase_Cu-bd domain-containing protein n=1 Tax=Steinernema glaseri TaxID=37863 RepID=A0A1I8A9H6_9BILA
MAFRKFYPDLGLPYWDSTLDANLPEPKDSVWFSDELMGDTNATGYVVTGKYAYWKTLENKDAILRLLAQVPDGEFFSDGRIDWVVNQQEVDRVLAYTQPLETCLNYTLDDRFLEYSHDYVHYYINGDMFTKYGSSNDPIFFMHHTFIDLVWEEWRQKRQTREQRENDYPADRYECSPPFHFRDAKMALLAPFKNIDGCSNKYTDNMFEFAPRPTCTNLDRNCRSEYLFCDYLTGEEPKCSAKVKLGGNCSGFEPFDDACYRGRCVKGRCISDKQWKKMEKKEKYM